MFDITRILSQIEQGDPCAAEKLLPLVYDELRQLAAAKLVQENPGQTLQATALVHEPYVRLVGNDENQKWDILEILDDEMVGTLNGQSLTGQHPLIASAKNSIMFVSNGEGSARNLRVWEALPNPDWAKQKAALAEAKSQGTAK